MKVGRHIIVQSLYDQGHPEEAVRAEKELPDPVDTDANAHQLDSYDLDLREVLFKLSGEFDSKS
jgi:hypothetical protein